ncbi:hypothetical protein GmHk_06G017389 [Glycine max]|nr:hypothetical protein GmHk_06G017389 [Glycine max]
MKDKGEDFESYEIIKQRMLSPMKQANRKQILFGLDGVAKDKIVFEILKHDHATLSSFQPTGLIRQVCEVLIFTFSLSQSAGLASHPLNATLLD